MTDLSKTIAPKSDQLNADDLIAGPRTIKITKVTGSDNDDQPIWIHFEGDNGRPYKPGLSMRRVLVQVWGEEGDAYVGRSMTLYCDREVKFGGIKVGGIRISHMSHIDRNAALMLTATRGRKNEYVVKPLATDPNEQALLTAQDAADEGTEKFTEFWNSPFGKKHRAFLKQHIDDLKARAQRADDAAVPLSQRIQRQEEDKAAPETDTPDHTPHAPDPFSKEYDAGMKAFGSDEPCPYDEGTDQHRDWMAGYEFKKGETDADA